MYKSLILLAVVSIAKCATFPTPLQLSELKVEKSSKPEVRTVQEHLVVPILNQDSQIDSDGSFKWSYESADGTKAEQVGEIKTLDKENIVESVMGSYAYVDPEGKSHEVHYVANENGFIPSGDDIAPEIVRHLDYIVSHPHPISTEFE